MQDKKDSKLGDSFYNAKDNKWYYFDGINWVLGLYLIYENYKGVVAERCVIPLSIFFGVTEYHRQSGYMLHSWDIEKKAYRDFALVNVVKFL